MTTPPTPPAWAAEYLRFAAWTQDEFRNLLCGLPLVRPQQTNDEYVRDELRRADADRHMLDAIVAGHLTVLDPPDERLLEKVRPHVDAVEVEALRRAVAHDRSCSKAYRVAPDEAIRWASSRRDLFPHFPFTLGHLQSASTIASS